MGDKRKEYKSAPAKLVSIAFEGSRGRLIALDAEGNLWQEKYISPNDPEFKDAMKYNQAGSFVGWQKFRNPFEGEV